MTDDANTAEWRVVPDFPDYEVSDHGSVRRCVQNPHYKVRFGIGSLVSQWPYRARMRRDGSLWHYWAVTLADGKRHKSFLVHTLVLITFVGPKPSEAHFAAHNNGTSTDNRALNLRWATASENQMDRAVHGTSNRGSSHPLAKLTERDVLDIVYAIGQGAGIKALGIRYGISHSQISMIKSGKVWKHITAGSARKSDDLAAAQTALANSTPVR